VAGAWLAGAGGYRFSGNQITGTTAVPHGAGTRCGDGVYAVGTAAWDGTGGLWLSDNTLADNQGAGLFLDDAHALLSGNAWADNAPDLLAQGDACLSPLDTYFEAPEHEVCPEWDQPACALQFALGLVIAEVDPGEPRPRRALPVLPPPLRPGLEIP
jgi:hypothetical protein